MVITIIIVIVIIIIIEAQHLGNTCICGCTEGAPEPGQQGKVLKTCWGMSKRSVGFKVSGLYRGYILVIHGLYRENGEENGSYYFGFKPVTAWAAGS